MQNAKYGVQVIDPNAKSGDHEVVWRPWMQYAKASEAYVALKRLCVKPGTFVLFRQTIDAPDPAPAVTVEISSTFAVKVNGILRVNGFDVQGMGGPVPERPYVIRVQGTTGSASFHASNQVDAEGFAAGLVSETTTTQPKTAIVSMRGNQGIQGIATFRTEAQDYRVPLGIGDATGFARLDAKTSEVTHSLEVPQLVDLHTQLDQVIAQSLAAEGPGNFFTII